MTQKAQKTIVASLGLVLLLVALALPFLELEQYRGDIRFASLSVLLFAIAGGLYFWATRPDLLRFYWIVLATIVAIGTLLLHWTFQRIRF